MPEVLGLDIVTEYLVDSFRACSQMLGQYKILSLSDPYFNHTLLLERHRLLLQARSSVQKF